MVEVVIPWRAGCPHRERALTWILRRHAERHPGWIVTVAEAPDGAWSKARAVMPAIARSAAAVIVVADADVWTPDLSPAVLAVQAGVSWAIPHRLVHRLTENATHTVLDGGHATETCERPYIGLEGGGILTATRQTFLAVPMDPRFVGWGQEDMSHAVALNACHGRPWRGQSSLVHFYHPPQPRMTRTRGSQESWQLYRRYLNARRDPNTMRALLEEANADLDLPHPAVPDRPS